MTFFEAFWFGILCVFVGVGVATIVTGIVDWLMNLSDVRAARRDLDNLRYQLMLAQENQDVLARELEETQVELANALYDLEQAQRDVFE